MIDLKKETKAAYDAAAEELCEHVYTCDGCSLTGGRMCETGRPLFEAENTAWTAYMEARR